MFLLFMPPKEPCSLLDACQYLTCFLKPFFFHVIPPFLHFILYVRYGSHPSSVVNSSLYLFVANDDNFSYTISVEKHTSIRSWLNCSVKNVMGIECRKNPGRIIIGRDNNYVFIDRQQNPDRKFIPVAIWERLESS